MAKWKLASAFSSAERMDEGHQLAFRDEERYGLPTGPWTNSVLIQAT